MSAPYSQSLANQISPPPPSFIFCKGLGNADIRKVTPKDRKTVCVCVCVFDKEIQKRLQCGRINGSLVLVPRTFPNTLLRQSREDNSEEHRIDLPFLNSQPLTPSSYSVK